MLPLTVQKCIIFRNLSHFSVKCKEIIDAFPTYVPSCPRCQCGTNAECKDRICLCPPGFTGDPFVSCNNNQVLPNFKQTINRTNNRKLSIKSTNKGECKSFILFISVLEIWVFLNQVDFKLEKKSSCNEPINPINQIHRQR